MNTHEVAAPSLSLGFLPGALAGFSFAPALVVTTAVGCLFGRGDHFGDLDLSLSLSVGVVCRLRIAFVLACCCCREGGAVVRVSWWSGAITSNRWERHSQGALMCAALAPPPSLTLACSRCLLSLTLGSVDGPLLYVHGFSSRCWPHRLTFSHPFVCLHIHISGAFAPMGNAITCTLSFLQLSIGSILQLPSLSLSAGDVPGAQRRRALLHVHDERADDAVASGVDLADRAAVRACCLDDTAGRCIDDVSDAAGLCVERVFLFGGHGLSFGLQIGGMDCGSSPQ